MNLACDWEPEAAWHAHSKGIVALAWAPASRLLASGGNDGEARIWDTSAPRAVMAFAHPGGAVRALSWAPNELAVLAAWEDGTSRLVHAVTGQVLRVHADHRAWVADAAHCPDGTMYATASGDRSIQLYDAQSGRCIRTVWSEYGGFMSLAWSPDGRHLATANRGTLVSLWDPASWRLVDRLEFGDTVWSLDWHPDSSTLAVAGGSGRVCLWRTGGGHAEWLRPHGDTVARAAFAAEGRFLLTLSHDETLEAREVPGLARLGIVRSTYPGAAHCLATSPRHALVAGTDRTGCCVELRRIPDRGPAPGAGQLTRQGTELQACAVVLAEAALLRGRRAILSRAGALLPAALEGRSQLKLHRSALDVLARRGALVNTGATVIAGQNATFARAARQLWLVRAPGEPARCGPVAETVIPGMSEAEWRAALRSWLWTTRDPWVPFVLLGETCFFDLQAADNPPPAVEAALAGRDLSVFHMTGARLARVLTTLLMSRAATAAGIWHGTAAICLQGCMAVLVRWSSRGAGPVQAGLVMNGPALLLPAQHCLRTFVSALLAPPWGEVMATRQDPAAIEAAAPLKFWGGPSVDALCKVLGPPAAAAALWEEAADRRCRQMRRDTLAVRRHAGLADVVCLHHPKDAAAAAAFLAAMESEGLCATGFPLLHLTGDGALDRLTKGLPAIALLLGDDASAPAGFCAAFRDLVECRDSRLPRLRWLPVALPSFDRGRAVWVPDFLDSFDWHSWDPGAGGGALPGSLVFAALGDRSRA